MAKFRFLQNSFKSGELGSRLLGRTNSTQYQEACSEVLNLLPIKQGGLTRRMGTKYVYTSLSSPAIIPFIFSKTEGFAILINHSGEKPVAIDKDGILQLIEFSSKSINTLTMLDWSWVIDLDPNGWHHTQSGDVIVAVHNSGTVPPLLIKRQPSGDPIYPSKFKFEWYLEEDDFGDQNRKKALRWTYQPINIDEKWLSFQSGAGTTQDIKAYNEQSESTTIDDFWHEDEVGSLIRVVPYSGSSPNNVELIYRVDSLAATPTSHTASCTLVLHGSQTTPFTAPDISAATFTTKDWRKSYWSDFNGWPKTVTQFEQRLFFGGSKQFPDTIWSSKTGNILHMMRQRFEQDKLVSDKKNDVTGLDFFGVETASDPLELTPAANEINKIQWIHGGAVLYVGTIGAEFMLTGGDVGLSNDSLNFKRHTSVGSSDVMATSNGKASYFVSRNGRRLYDLSPVDVLNSQERDLNILNEDIIKHNTNDSATIEKIVSQQSTNTIWALNSEQELVGFTSDSSGGVNAWHRHSIGGNGSKVFNIGVITNETGEHDDLWLAVTRKGVGLTVNTDTVATAPLDTPTDYGTGFSFSYFMSWIAFEGTQLKPGTVTIRVPEDVDVSSLAGTWFSFYGDALEYSMWFDDTVGQTATEPVGMTGDFKWRINIYGATTDDDVIAAIVAATGSGVDSTNGYETIERIGETFSHEEMFNTSTNEVDKPYFVDSSVRSYDSTAKLAHDGFDHLIGETVQVIADGFYIGEKVVSSVKNLSPLGLDGTITLDNEANEVIAGHGYTSRLKTFPVEAGSDFGSAIGIIQRIDKIILMLYKTFGLTAGYEIDKLDDLELLPPDYTVGSQLPLFTGRQPIFFPASPDDEQAVIIEQTKPYPCTVLAINMRGKTYDGSQ